MGREMSDQVEIEGTIGDDSPTGLAFKFQNEEGEDFWIPYSLVTQRKISGVKGGDSIRIPVWFADKQGIE